MPLIETKGAASAQGFGEFTASAPKLYIEDVFSTYLYAGNGSTQTITNGIDLSGKGGLVWIKNRTDVGISHYLWDTVRGITPSSHKSLQSDTTAAQVDYSNDFGVQSVSATGFALGSLGTGVNGSASNYASWTFRKQPKFFDVVTYTGNGSTNTISHALGSTPGAIFIKKTSSSGPWVVYHRSITSNYYLNLNTTAAETFGSTWISSVGSTSFTLDGGSADWNQSGQTFVAYLFAHNAGGFGLSGTDNVISCGSWTGNATVNLGFEPQWILFKKSSEGGGAWFMQDVMRGMPVSGDARQLVANTLQAEAAASVSIRPNATGFSIDPGTLGSGDVIIYIAIRRGPMKVPTSGTSVFSPVLRNGTGADAFVSAGFPVDLAALHLTNTANNEYVGDRLRGNGGLSLEFKDTDAEADRSAGGITSMASMTGYTVGVYSDVNSSGNTYINWCFRRAPGFFDVVCYTGTGASTELVYHNLGASPELVIIKRRNSTSDWMVNTLSGGSIVYSLGLNSTSADNATNFQGTAYSASTYIGVRTGTTLANISGATYVAYLFATVAGVSKVGSYTGTGTTKQIDCGFTGGARFVLIKRTDSTGDWYVYDTARGIVSGNDSYLLLNSTAAEVTNTDYVDTYSAGFELSSTAPAGLNANGGTYIFLAIA